MYILETVCYIKKYKETLEQNVQIHNHSDWKKLISKFSSVTWGSVVNMRISLHNKVPDYTKTMDKNKSFKPIPVAMQSKA
jgi:hypothetical protein